MLKLTLSDNFLPRDAAHVERLMRHVLEANLRPADIIPSQYLDTALEEGIEWDDLPPTYTREDLDIEDVRDYVPLDYVQFFEWVDHVRDTGFVGWDAYMDVRHVVEAAAA